jgi:periplasmic copper chaperone A
MRKGVAVLMLVGLAVVPAAMAHVEPTPEKVPANSVSKITLSAEGEESVPAVKLTVQMPAGVTDVVAHPTRGWKQSVNGRIVTWSGGTIANGEEGEFAFTAHMPNTPGQVLVFPALVTYQDGKVVHWIGAEASDTPAPRVTLTAAAGQTQPPPPPPATTVAPTETSDAGDGGGNNWIWIFIAAAILASLAAVVLVRRRRA